MQTTLESTWNLTCPECAIAKQNPGSGVYQFNCRNCRQRLILKNNCKEVRKKLVIRFRKWGENEATEEGVCKCKEFCYRQRMVDGRG